MEPVVGVGLVLPILLATSVLYGLGDERMGNEIVVTGYRARWQSI
jgi:hypothetical protein